VAGLSAHDKNATVANNESLEKREMTRDFKDSNFDDERIYR